MSTPVNELTEIDYDILAYISKFESIPMEQIAKHFSEKVDSIDLRVSQLASLNYSSSGNFTHVIPHSSYLYEKSEKNEYDECIGKNIFYISPLGKKALQDYRQKNKSDNRLLWKTNAWIPIIVAFVTTVITNYILPRLPLIIEWIFDLLPKTP